MCISVMIQRKSNPSQFAANRECSGVAKYSNVVKKMNSVNRSIVTVKGSLDQQGWIRRDIVYEDGRDG